MATEGYFKRTAFGLSPVSANADICESIPMGNVVRVKISQDRNYEHLKKFFALIAVVFPHQDTWATIDTFRDKLLCAAGHCEEYETLIRGNGKMQKAVGLRAKSISFAKLGQHGFNQVYDNCVEVILGKILRGVSSAELEAQVLDILEGRKAA